MNQRLRLKSFLPSSGAEAQLQAAVIGGTLQPGGMTLVA